MTDEIEIISKLFQVSDQQNVGNFTLKTDLLFSHPVVFDYEEEKYVGIVEQHNKKRLCTWSDEQTDYKEWKKKVVSIPSTLSDVLSCTIGRNAKIVSCWNIGGWTSSLQTNSENFGGTICEMPVLLIYNTLLNLRCTSVSDVD